MRFPRFALLLFSLFAITIQPRSADFLDRSGSPARDPADPAIWPNQTSRANSDPWLVQHHDSLRLMQPRVLLVNFSQEASREHLVKLTTNLFAALKESSRYHGYADSNAPAFLDYQLFKFIDLRDAGKTKGNSSRIPLKIGVTNGYNVDYNALFSDAFAANLHVPDPLNASRYLRLDELVAGGYVHELWFFGEGAPDVVAYECVEEKPVYDEHFVRKGDAFLQAGNGGDPDQKWTGRSLRIGFINASRGIGCYMESLSHSFEGMANCGALPWLKRYFREYAGFDLQERFQLPFESFYALWGEGNGIAYPDERTALIRRKGKEYRLENYMARGGNVHFPPNGRRDYDLDHSEPVLSTIEDWRIGSGANGQDRAIPWTNERFARYRALAPDCMGPWLIYWRQNIPGLNNRQKDDEGKPMKNWWPFLYY